MKRSDSASLLLAASLLLLFIGCAIAVSDGHRAADGEDWEPPAAEDLDDAWIGDAPSAVDEVFGVLGLIQQPFALEAPIARIPGAIRRETGDTVCEYETMTWEYPDGRSAQTRFPSPWVNFVDREPMVGREVAADFLTAIDSAPSWPQFLLAEIRDTFDSARYPTDSLGIPGCWLQVDLSRCFPVWPGGDPSNWAYGDGGARIRVRFTPTPDLVGRTVVLQSVVLPPRDVVHAGIVLGPALLVAVGEAR